MTAGSPKVHVDAKNLFARRPSLVPSIHYRNSRVHRRDADYRTKERINSAVILQCTYKCAGRVVLDRVKPILNRNFYNEGSAQ